MRKLRQTLKAEKRHMRLMGLKRTDIPEWVNRTLIELLNQKPSPVVRRVTRVAKLFQDAARLSEELRLIEKGPAYEAQTRKLDRLLEPSPVVRPSKWFQDVARLSEKIRLIEEKSGWTAQMQKLNRIMTDLNDIVSTYSAHPRILVDISGASAPLISHYEYSARSEKEAREKVAIQFLVEHTELVSRIRRCLECRAWFFAVTDHQKYCRSNCRQRHASQSEVFKAKRARYMREKYRPAQIELDSRAKKLLSTELKGR